MSTCYVESSDVVYLDCTLVNWNDMGDTISGIKDGTCSVTFSHEGKKGLELKGYTSKIILFKHDFSHLFPILVWVECRLRQKNLLI